MPMLFENILFACRLVNEHMVVAVEPRVKAATCDWMNITGNMTTQRANRTRRTFLWRKEKREDNMKLL